MTTGSALTLLTSEKLRAYAAAAFPKRDVTTSSIGADKQPNDPFAIVGLVQSVQACVPGIVVQDLVLSTSTAVQFSRDVNLANLALYPVVLESAYGFSAVDLWCGDYPLVSVHGAFAEFDASLSRDAKLEADRALEQLSGDLGHQISSRLHELISLAEEEDSPTSLPSAQSFRALVDFLVQNRTYIKPALTLDDEGLVWAEWRKSPDCLVALRFLADGMIRWVIISPAPLRRSGRVVWRGDGGAEDVRSAIDARPAVNWIARRSGIAA